jgi:nucleoside-diphosphate-sugar epimerase
VRIFVAGATGVIGVRLVPLLVADGYTVAGMTRSPGKAGLLRELGAEPVVCDVFDVAALTQAVAAFGPDVVFHQLTDLPDEAADLGRFSDRNDRIRGEGTRNLLAAAAAAKAQRVIAQSISWELPSGNHRIITARTPRAPRHRAHLERARFRTAGGERVAGAMMVGGRPGGGRWHVVAVAAFPR